KGSPCSPVTRVWTVSRERLMNVDPGPGPAGLEGADQSLHPLVVALERVLAEDGLALGVVELQVDPVHAVVLAFEVGLPDELAVQPGASRLQLERRDGAPVLEADRLAQGRVVADVADGLDGGLQAVVPVEEPVLDHVEDEGGSAHLEVRGDLGHVRIAHDDVKATVLLRVRVRLVARVDDGARGGGGPRDLLADVLGPLRETVVEAAGGLEYLAR